MKKKILSVVSILVILTLSACGQAAEPTLSADDIAATALDQAFTQLAQTQAALPTATIPPTNTPLPTLTPFPTSTPFPTVPAFTATAAAGPCEGVPPAEPLGGTAEIRFVNKTKAPVTLSWGMSPANSQGECGIYSISMGAYESPTMTIMSGCYWGYAWINGNKPSIAQTTGAICVGMDEDISVTIGTETIGPD